MCKPSAPALRATNNDAPASWCSTPTGSTYGATMRRGTPGAANVACVAPPACLPATHLVLNEIDYDQSGSDAAELLGPDGVLDAAIYEGTMGTITLMGGAASSLAESGSIGTDSGDGGLSRRPDGCDRDMPTMDWAAAPVTPGAANM